MHNDALLQKFNDALNSIKQDGTYQALYQKWFQQ
ncbi:transporter substrate-binding domain-containing protein [Lonsdalea populi]